MKRTSSKIFSALLILCFLCLPLQSVFAYDPNPQGGFAPTVLLANPSTYLNFNDATASFEDQISGLATVGVETKTVNSVYAGYFDGSTNFVQIPSATQLAVATFTTTGWYHFNATKVGQYLVFRGTVANHPNIYLWYATNSLSCGFYGTDSSYHEVDYSFTPSTANDYYLSCSYSGSAISLYVNGSLVDSISTSASPLTSGTQNLFIGGTAGGASFEGLGWANELYNVALSQGQIAALMAGGSPPSGLVGDWQLNEGTGSTATDSSTYGDNGTWNGTASGNYGYYEGPTTTTYTSGTVTPRQPGFDSTLANNTSAEFPWNGWSAAPNNTLGSSMEWNTPWSMMVQVDRLNWNRTGTLVLASKGDLATGSSWSLYLQMTANTDSGANGQVSQLCFSRTSPASGSNIYGVAANGICTSSTLEAMPNGFNYNIIVTDSGTGASGLFGTTSPLDIYVNGLDKTTGLPETPFTASFQYGFGDVAITVSGGTGYANSTAFTSSGGGANCHVTGAMTASGGVPNGINLAGNSMNYGCTSVPTITLTSPTGTGVTITATLGGSSMNSTSYPLMVPGYVSGGTYYGIAGATSTQTPTYIDEFAIFPGVLNLTQINDLFYWTKFYQSLLYPAPTSSVAAQAVIMDGSGCGGDPSGAYQVIVTMAAHHLGLINLLGMVNSDSSGLAAAWGRQMLDQAGLSNVPLSQPITTLYQDNSNCPDTTLAVYNASTSTNASTYESSTTMYRQIFAANPTVPIDIMIGQSFTAYAAFLASPADSISSLTGQQMNDQNAANGGFINAQGGLCPVAPALASCNSTYTGPANTYSNVLIDPAAAQYVLANHGALPIYFMQGNNPQGDGIGLLYTRPAHDPAYRDIENQFIALGGTFTGRQGWNSQQLSQLISPYFTGGVQVTYSGGTGYANQTFFTSTGGGTYCHVEGMMTASGGVPNGIYTIFGSPLTNYWGNLGYGCTSAPTLVLTSPTGTGVTLNTYPTTFCKNVTVAPSGSNWTEAETAPVTCSGIYATMPSINELYSDWVGGFSGAMIYAMFENSLIDPPTNGRPLAGYTP